jgi:hypothetical protein
MAEQINVSMEPWFSDLPPDDVICGLTGRILDVFVEQEVGSESAPIGEFFRFARALVC